MDENEILGKIALGGMGIAPSKLAFIASQFNVSGTWDDHRTAIADIQRAERARIKREQAIVKLQQKIDRLKTGKTR